MPMAPYTRIDFNNRVSALRTVGTALSIATNQMPAQSCANSSRTYLRFINNYRVAKSLGRLPNLDYSAFVPALNVLVALVP